jgi:hypothetical protein
VAIYPWHGCVVRVEDLPWGGWLVSWWGASGLVAVVEVRPWDRVRVPDTLDGLASYRSDD